MKKKRLISTLIISGVILSLFLASSLSVYASLPFETRDFTFTVDELVQAFEDSSTLYVVDRSSGELIPADEYGFTTKLYVQNYKGSCAGCWQVSGMDYSTTDFVIDLTLSDLSLNVNQMSLTSWNASSTSNVPTSTSISQQILGTYVRVGNVDYNQEYFYSDTVWYDHTVPITTLDSDRWVVGFTNNTRTGKFTKLEVDYNAGWDSSTKSPLYMPMNRITLEYRKYGDVTYNASTPRYFWFELSEITGTEVLTSDQLIDDSLSNIESTLGNVDQGLLDDYLADSSTSNIIQESSGNVSKDINDVLLRSRDLFDIPIVDLGLDIYENVILVDGFAVATFTFSLFFEHPAISLLLTYSFICVVASFILFGRKG